VNLFENKKVSLWTTA